jgi:hypothetical protein
MARTNLIEQLRELDAVLMSNDPTVKDAFKQAVVLTKVVEDSMNINPVGPLEHMGRELQDMRREIDKLKNNINFDNISRQTGTYWSAQTYERGRNYDNWGLTTNSIAQLPQLSAEEISALVNDTYYGNITVSNSGMVTPASPTDSDAFTLFDPDTGDSMSVKYK